MIMIIDYVEHDYLKYRLLMNGIEGDIYRSIKDIYTHPESCVLVNHSLTDWFPAKSGVRQGDSLSPILFVLFINDLAHELNDYGKGIQIGDTNLSIRMYVDDVVILSDYRSSAQEQLDIMTKWCNTWGMIPNI